MFIGVLWVPYWSKLLNVENWVERERFGAPVGNAGHDSRLDRISTLMDITSIAAYPGKRMVRAHAVDPHQCES